ncbi:MAG TPA: divalent-cation tolerance protein CutA [Ktedonobacteraceae bacterium]|nr:divalent-cation tolerance protein CutA [Ktedonobacteraceae bacterium]
MTEFIQVTTAIDSREGAQKIARMLVEQHLAACVHVAGPITSTYWWQGKMEIEEEWTCAAKTRKELYGKVEKAIREAHPYDEPEIVALPLVQGSQSYLDWIGAETTQ